MEDISGETLRVHSHQNARVRRDVAEDKRDVLVLVDVIAVADDAPRSEFGRKPSLGDAMHEPLGLEAMRHELRDGDEREAVLLREALQLGATGARAVLAQNLADHPRRNEAGKAGEVNGRLGVAHALEYSSSARAKRRDVSRTAQIGGNSLGIDSNTDGFGAILRAHSRGDAKALVRIDADGESGTVLVGVGFALLSELELVGTFPRKRETNPPARLTNHEVDHFRRDQLRRTDEIAFVLAILIVGDDDQLASLDVGYCLLDCSELHDSSNGPAKNRPGNLAPTLRASRAPGVDARV